jgi:hypothetical protein
MACTIRLQTNFLDPQTDRPNKQKGKAKAKVKTISFSHTPPGHVSGRGRVRENKSLLSLVLLPLFRTSRIFAFRLVFIWVAPFWAPESLPCLSWASWSRGSFIAWLHKMSQRAGPRHTRHPRHPRCVPYLRNTQSYAASSSSRARRPPTPHTSSGVRKC